MKVNTELLQKKIKDSGLKMGFIAEKLGRSRQALSDKIKGETELFCDFFPYKSQNWQRH